MCECAEKKPTAEGQEEEELCALDFLSGRLTSGASLTLSSADGVHQDVVLVDLVLVMLELPPQVGQLVFGELPRGPCLAEEQSRLIATNFNSKESPFNFLMMKKEEQIT